MADVKIRLLVSRSGNSESHPPGAEIIAPAEEAARMQAEGQCEILRDRQPKTAVKRARPEKAARG